ncbi:MAG: crossover junction endodeoxyribonuclease RuvC [Proteobacteria bacterium]|nr:crossover junction endodeoxyribonuclease RuvC [Pseudomonadota bacterium]MBU1686831.1 crossover junction endodeoxyribonuclease RuvC [Pseudomonadota bacterium]
MRILGIDPGSRATGYGVIDVTRRGLNFISCGVIRVSPSLSFSERLGELYAGLAEVITLHGPDRAAIEDIFMAKNAQSALKLGHARGVLILAVTRRGLPLAEYTPRHVKQAVAGFGNAEKVQVQNMVRVILSLAKAPSQDASDALAVAICHANHCQVEL